MNLSKNAIGNLITRYTAVLKKCAMINLLATGLLFGAHGGGQVWAEPNSITNQTELTNFLEGNTSEGILSPESGNSISIDWGEDGKTVKGTATTKYLYFGGNTLNGSGKGIIVSGTDDTKYTLYVYGGSSASDTSKGTMSGFGDYDGDHYWGALNATGTGALFVSGIKFTDIAAGKSGVFSQASEITISNSEFLLNIPTYDTRAYGVFVRSIASGIATITDSSFKISNTESSDADTYGVNVYPEAGQNSGSVSVNRSSFEVEIDSSSENNSYGVYINASFDGKGEATISDSSFKVSNSSTENDLGSIGVYISAYTTATVTVNNSFFEVHGSNDGDTPQGFTYAHGRGYGIYVDLSPTIVADVAVAEATAKVSNSSFEVYCKGDRYVDDDKVYTFGNGEGYGVYVVNLKSKTAIATISNCSFAGTGIGICSRDILFTESNTVNSIQSNGTIINEGTLALTSKLEGFLDEDWETTYGIFTNKGTLKMAVGATAAVSSFVGSVDDIVGDLTIGVDLQTTNNSSRITVGYEDSDEKSGDVNGTVNLTRVNIAKDSSSENPIIVTYVDKYADEETRTTPSGTYTINGSDSKDAKLITSTAYGTYTIKLHDTLGQIIITKDSTVGGFTLAEFINGVNSSSTPCPADTYSITETQSLAGATTFSSDTNRGKNLTVYFNGYTIPADSGSSTGITVDSGYTLSLDGLTTTGVSTMSGFSTASTVNSGKLKILDMTFTENSTDIDVQSGEAVVIRSTFKKKTNPATTDAINVGEQGKLTFSAVNYFDSSITNAGTVVIDGALHGVTTTEETPETTYGTFKNTGTLNMTAGATMDVSALSGNGDLTIGIDFSNAEPSSSKITVNGTASNATVNLIRVNVVDTTGVSVLSGSVRYVDNGSGSAPKGITYDGLTNFVTSTINGTYCFQASEGKLSWDAPSSGFTLAEFIDGKKVVGATTTDCPANIYSLIRDDTSFVGATTSTSTTLPAESLREKELTVYFNDYTVSSSATASGITVSNGYTLNVNGGEMKGFSTALNVTEGTEDTYGTLNITNLTFTNNTTDISAGVYGRVNFYNTNTVKKVEGSGNIANYGNLSISSGGSFVASNVTLGGGNLTVEGTLGTKDAAAPTLIFDGGILTISGGTVYAKDTYILGTKSYMTVSSQLITPEVEGKIIGSGGELALWLTGTDIGYTASYLSAVKSALFGDIDIKLSFINGELKEGPTPDPDPTDPSKTITKITNPETGEEIYVVSGDTKFSESLGETEIGTIRSVEICGNKLIGSGIDKEGNGATVVTASIMSVNNGTMTAFSTALTTQEGSVLNVSDLTFTGNKKDIVNNGTVNFSGTNILDSLEGNGTAINKTNSTLSFRSASGLACDLTNEGTVSLGAGELSSNIYSENGTVKSTGEVTSTSKVITKSFELSGASSYGLKTGGALDILESTTLNGTLEAKEGGNITMSKGAELSIKNDGKVKLTGGFITMDAKNVMSSDYTSTQGSKIDGQKGLLALRLENASDAAQKIYTKAEYRQAKAALLGESGENAKLGFIYGTVQADENESVVIGGDQTSGKVVINGNTPVLAENSKTAKESNINLIYEPNRNVRIVDETKRVDEATLTAPEIAISNTIFIVKGLEVATDTKSVSITLKENAVITLIGGDDAEKSVVAKNGKQAEIPTSFIVKEGTELNFGLAENINNQKAKITGVLVEDRGVHNVDGNGTDKTQFTYEALEIRNNGSNQAYVSVTNAVLNVGSLKTSGGSIYVDPAYLKASTLSGDSFGAALLIAKGSVVNFGTDLELLKEVATNAGFTPSIVDAGFTLKDTQTMIAINEHMNLGNTGKIIVDASVQPDGSGSSAKSTDKVYFGNESLLVVNGNAITEQAAISSTLAGATASIGDTAKLYIANARGGKSYFILKIDGEISGSSGWKDANLITDSDMLDATFHYVNEDGNEKGWVSVTSKSASEIYPNLDGKLVKLMNNLYENGLNDAYSDIAGVRFLSRATNKSFLGRDPNASTQAIESVARIAMAGAVPQMTLMASETLSEAMGNRMNIANGYNSTILDQEFKTGLALWITPLWKNQSGWGMEAFKQNYGFNANIGGIALGADYSFSESLKAGVAFNIGGGYAKSSGDLSSTENHMKFWGIGVYGGYNDGRISVMGDASYTSTYNKLEQDLDQRIQMRNLKADVRAAVWSVGIRGDYKFTFDALDITPHLGVRYMNISSQEYDIKGGGTVAKSDGIQQSFWSIPVGVTFGKDFKTANGWSLTPSVDFTVTPRFGDLKAYESIRFTGVPGDAGLHTQTRDYVSYKGTAGLGAKYGNIGLNLNYSYEAGSCTSGHGVNASFRWEF